MSHELRTPLNAINGFSEMMVAEMFGPARRQALQGSYVQDILSSGQHLLALINDVLDMSKIEAGKMNLRFEPVRLDELAEDAVRLIKNRAETGGLTRGDRRAAAARGRGRLPRAEAGAAEPALQRGEVHARAAGASRCGPRAGATRMGERVKISVRDTGIGIAPHDLARLARPFEQIESQQSKTQQGTGLGLALSKSLVEMHGGVLEIESQPGVGTTVSFLLPVRQTGAWPQDDRSSAAA